MDALALGGWAVRFVIAESPIQGPLSCTKSNRPGLVAAYHDISLWLIVVGFLCVDYEWLMALYAKMRTVSVSMRFHYVMREE